MVTYVPGTEREFFEAMPLQMYKYRIWSNPHHQKLLSELELFFPEPKLFNDPYDCGLPFRADPSDYDPVRIKEKLEALAPKQFPMLKHDPKAMEQEVAKQLFHIQQDPDTYFQEQYAFEKDHLSSMYGVLSLTPHPANFLMWSHYSDGHKGFVMGFDTEQLVRQNFGTFAKVTYSEEIPTISVLNMDIHTMHRLIYTKAKIWEYEDEHRITRILSPNTKAIAHHSTFRTVHLGINMTQADRFAIIKIVQEKYPSINVFEMTLGNKKFELIPSRIY
jgi:hypothetical protein